MAAASKYSDDQKAACMQLFRSHGASEAARMSGVPKGTVASWARRAGIQTNAPVEREAAVESAAIVNEERRLRLAEGLLDDVQGLRRELFAPTTYHHVKTLAGAVGLGASVEVVELDLAHPVHADQLRLVQAIGVLVDKVQLLTGQATERVDLTGEYDLEAELRAYQQGLLDRGSVQP